MESETRSMTVDDFVRLTNARGRYPRWRAKCPIHKSRGLTLAIYAQDDGIGLHCFAGCANDDILATWGLTWKNLKLNREWLPPEQYREAMKKRAMRAEIDNLKRQQGLLIMLEAIDKSKPVEAWQAARGRVEDRIWWVRYNLEPELVGKEEMERIWVQWARLHPVESEIYAGRKVMEYLDSRVESNVNLSHGTNTRQNRTRDYGGTASHPRTYFHLPKTASSR